MLTRFTLHLLKGVCLAMHGPVFLFFFFCTRGMFNSGMLNTSPGAAGGSTGSLPNTYQMCPAGGNGSPARQIAEQQLQMMQMAVGGSSEIRLPDETAKRIPSRLDWDTSIFVHYLISKQCSFVPGILGSLQRVQGLEPFPLLFRK